MSGYLDLQDWVGLALVGYRGTGKSIVGRMVADYLRRSFVDADVELEMRWDCSIRSIFETEGEPVFRDREAEMLAELTAKPAKKVLATGGGVVLRESNRAALRRFGHVVWLRASPETIAGRLQHDVTRPALTAAGTLGEIADVVAIREPLYREVADTVVDTDGRELRRVRDEIILSLSDFKHSWRKADRRGGVLR